MSENKQKALLDWLSLALSAVLHPIFIPTYAVVLLCVAQMRNMGAVAEYASAVHMIVGSTFVLTCVLPLAMLLSQYFKGQISDISISDRRERYLPYAFALFCMLLWCGMFCLIHVQGMIRCMLISACVLMIMVVLINLRWKISIHLAAYGALTGAVMAYCWGYQIANYWLFPLLCLVALLLMLARIKLKSHTPMQVVCGFLLGLTILFVPVVVLAYAGIL